LRWELEGWGVGGHTQRVIGIVLIVGVVVWWKQSEHIYGIRPHTKNQQALRSLEEKKNDARRKDGT
jgi:hypothetical protein